MQIPLPYGLPMIDITHTITLGNIIEIATIAIGGLIFLLKQNGTITLISHEVTYIKEKLKVVSEVVVNNAVINTRIANLEEDFRELKHGRGFVQNGLNGEWGERGKVK